MGKGKSIREKFVKLEEHEMRTPAYQTLTPRGRSLLMEFRRRFNGGENRILFSVRQMAESIGVSEKPAQKARDELLERRWIRIITQGTFKQKARHATIYALENIPLRGRDGETAPKGYMTWKPQEQNNTVGELTTDR